VFSLALPAHASGGDPERQQQGGARVKPTKQVRDARKDVRDEQARRRALLIVASNGVSDDEGAADGANGGSGRKGEGIRRAGEYAHRIVEELAAHGIDAEVQVTVRRKQATQAARAAAGAGVRLVIAAGDDATVSAVARGIVGTTSVLGIVPPDPEQPGQPLQPGPGHNGGGIAALLGIPGELGAACDLLAGSAGRPIAVGQVTVAEHKTPRLFFGHAAVGATAAMMPAGQDVGDRWWGGPAKSQPAAPHLTPTQADVRVDDDEPGRRATTLLVEIENAPHGPAGHVKHASESPSAAAGSAALDVRIYHDLDQVDLAARFVALEAGQRPKDARIEHARATRVDVRTAGAMPVTADARVVGTTPARFDLLPAALLVALGSAAQPNKGDQS
jgi:diacylglycerol kinase (ATP)